MGNILITGTSSGIGFHLSLHLARAGHHVIASMRDMSRSQRLRSGLERLGASHEIIGLDVTDIDACKRGVEGAITVCGSIDVLINNAGVPCPGAIEDVPIEAARAVFDTNYFGAVRMIQAVLPHMRSRRSGAIINISSVAGRFPMACAGHYGASKFALEGMSEALAHEVSQFGIKVALIEPGLVLTPMLAKNHLERTNDTPYLPQFRRAAALVKQRLRNRTMPLAVAAAVDAVLQGDKRFRYPVGVDAQMLSEMRRRVSDEDLIEAGALTDDHRFYDAMCSLVGLDLWRQ